MSDNKDDFEKIEKLPDKISDKIKTYTINYEDLIDNDEDNEIMDKIESYIKDIVSDTDNARIKLIKNGE